MEGGTTSIWGLYEQLGSRPHYKAYNSISGQTRGCEHHFKGVNMKLVWALRPVASSEKSKSTGAPTPKCLANGYAHGGEKQNLFILDSDLSLLSPIQIQQKCIIA